MSTVWVHELGMFIYLILALLQANKLSDNRFKKHNTIQQYVYITVYVATKCTNMPENSTHKCTNAVYKVQPIRNSSQMAKKFQPVTDCKPKITKMIMGAREG